jgi:hypothetical protein
METKADTNCIPYSCPFAGVEMHSREPSARIKRPRTSAEELVWFKEKTMYKRAIRSLGVLAVFTLILAAQPNPIPIPQQQGVNPAPEFIGNPAVPHAVAAPVIPKNPFMGINSGWNAIHNDTYMSDIYFTGGPLGYSPEVLLAPFADGTALGQVAAAVFFGDGKMIGGLTLVDKAAETVQSKLVLIDPTTLATLDTLPFSAPRPVELTRLFRPAGIYFYLDASDRVIAGTADRTIWVVSHTATKLNHDTTYDLTDVIPEADSIASLQPDFSGRIWVVTKEGLVATLDSNGNVLGTLHLPAGEKIANGHASDETDGVFIVSSEAMYRFDADATGKPAIT